MRATAVAALTTGGNSCSILSTKNPLALAEKANTPKLKILFSGDKKLVNTYHALCGQKDGKPASAKAAGFIAFVASPEGQDIIRAFGKAAHGESLYNDADYAKKYE